MPHYTDSRRARRKKLFAKHPSTFIKKPNSNSSILESSKMLHSKSTYFYRWGIPSVCGLALLLGGIVCINPILDNSKAYAEELDFDATNHVSADTTNTDSGIMTASDPAINLTITADSGNANGNVEVGKVAYFSNTITVGGTGISKYYLTLSTPSGSTGNLVGQKNPASTVGKVDYGTAPANFGDNTWGYAVSDNTSATNDGLLYNPVPSGTSDNNTDYLAFKASAPVTGGDKYKLVFAAKFDSSLPGDHYQANVYVSAIADAGIVVNLGLTNKNNETITNMQEMSADFCTNVEIGTEGKLADNRDKKIYVVAKLADHNCWMTQNLAYDGGGVQQCDLNGSFGCAGWPTNVDNVARYAKGTHINGDHTSQGNFYSWEAAMDSNTSATDDVQGICPDKWQLPTSGSGNINSKSFGGLTNAYSIKDDADGSTKLRSEPLYFQCSGNIYNGSLGNVGSVGNYWSSTPNSTSQAYFLHFTNTSNANPFISNSRSGGRSVRCVAK